MILKQHPHVQNKLRTTTFWSVHVRTKTPVSTTMRSIDQLARTKLHRLLTLT